MDKELLEKYFSNSCTEEELRSVLAWFEESADTTEGKALLYKIWEDLPDEDLSSKIHFDLLLDKIHHEINLTQSKVPISKEDRNIIRLKSIENIMKLLNRAAAILLLPILSYGLIMTFKYNSTKHSQVAVNHAFNEVISSIDAISKVTLPDGSIVWLNHNSSLRYPAVFNGKNRIVELIGEGYFEVVHNSKIPFIVNAKGIQIKAIGTTFNIMAYPDEDRVETSLINGLVELQRTETNGKLIHLVKMRPTELAIFQKGNNEISIRTINDDRYFSWKDGKLVFNKESIGEVIKKLSRWYNVDIQLKDPELLELTYTGTFTQETLVQVMELLAMVSPINYTISDRQLIGPGTFSKRKITLSYRNK